jgi:hypothetical protein
MDQLSWITLGTGLVAGLGVGSVLTALIQHNLKQKEVIIQSQRQDLEKRYKVLILLMYAAYDFSKNETILRIHRPDLKNQTAVVEELEAEWVNMFLFASKSTLDALRRFTLAPTASNLATCAGFMRIDLGRGRLDTTELGLSFSPISHN